TGAARYAGEAAPAGALHAVMVTSTIAAGEVSNIDSSEALRVPGVVRVLTHADMPRLQPPPSPPAAQAFTPMQGTEVRYEGQPVAIVLAETLEAGEEGLRRVRVSYRAARPTMFTSAATVRPRSAADKNGYAFAEIDTAKGSEQDLQAALRMAAARVDQTYATATRHHHPMEPSATVAQWLGDELHIWDSTQWIYGVRYALSAMLPIAPEKVHVRCPYTGGGFGGKGYVWPHQVLAVLAARVAGRPVKLNVGRAGMFTDSGYQPQVLNRLRLAADAQGRLTAVDHESTSASSMADDYIEYGAAGTRGLYATPVLLTRSRIRHCHVGTPTAMRAPHEGPGLFALESAMDELALQLNMDPLALRLANHADRDPADGKPFSSKKLREAYLEGARRFGWDKRPARPRAMRDGDWLVGWGMASCIMSTFRFASTARVSLKADGTVHIASGTQEIGTGPYTVMAQIASQSLGIPAERIRLTLGDTALPESGGAFGSSITLSLGSAVQDACEKLKARVKAIAPQARDLATALEGTGIDQVSADGEWKPHGGAVFDAFGGSSGYSMHTWGAVFVEVGVDEQLGLVRLRRAVGGYSAGRIVNPRTARSQMVGGIIWGWGQAALEESAMDERHGRYLSKNLSGVMVPVNADIPADIDVFFVDEFDPHASAIGARGIGELGATGVSAAVANAVWHATGTRLRKLPLHIPDLLG
ncbi:MAG: xanthine dehydrogenase family protein molybdopterin-binding subunit, partial [Chitinophagaceae bacterium]|nr:xanthine dehydrogenase family protein molybdopterin-binding subunit [Rubrivivax sp.]